MQNDRVKVLYVISSLANEGPTRILLNLVRNLDRQQFDPVVATLTAEKASSLYQQFESLHVPIKQLFVRPQTKWRPLLRRSSLRRLLQQGNFDIVHAHCPRSLLLLSTIKKGFTKIAYTLHGYPDVQYRAIHGPIKGPIITRLSNFALRFTDLPIACSDSVSLEYFFKRRQGYPFVNNGLEPFDVMTDSERQVTLQGFGLDPKRKYLLFAGRLSPEKRIVELVKTFCLLNKPAIDLVVVGSGPEEAALRAIFCSNVHLMGYQSDVRKFFSACDFYVSPSATEGLANSLLEALSVGMPCILSDIPSHRSVINRCGDAALTTFNPVSQSSLQAGIEYMISRDSTEERAAVRDQFFRHYEAKVMTSGYEAMYKEALT